MNLFNIERALKMKVERGWDTLYVAVDAHGTMVRPYHDKLEFYPGAIEVLRWFSNRTDFKLILWTSSHTEEVVELIEFAEKNGIVFDAANKNPFEKNTKHADFREKFYFNILLDDKAGFYPETDWGYIKDELIRLGLWCSEDADGIHDWNDDNVCVGCETLKHKWDSI